MNFPGKLAISFLAILRIFFLILKSPEALTGTVVEAHEPASSSSSVDAEREEAGSYVLLELLLISFRSGRIILH